MTCGFLVSDQWNILFTKKSKSNKWIFHIFIVRILPKYIDMELVKLLRLFDIQGNLHFKLHLIWFVASRNHLLNNPTAAYQNLLNTQFEGWLVPNTTRLTILSYTNCISFLNESKEKQICGSIIPLNL